MSNNLKKAKVQLVLTEPFFASLLLRLRQVENTNIDTACTDGETIEYNPAFFDPMPIEEIKTVLAHEVMHVALLHHTRRQGRNKENWNIAADHAINHILVNAGFDLPKGGLIDPKYRGMSAEDIYPLLPAPKEDEDGNAEGGNDPGGMGGVKDVPAKSKAELNEIEAKVKQAVSQAAMAAKKAGKLPADMERLVSEVLEPQVAWQDVLARFLTEIARNDYSWKKPNRRYIPSGIYLPSLENEEIGKIALIVDTSGSIGEHELNAFAGEMQAILSTFRVPFDVLYVDAEFQGIQHIEPDEEIKLKLKGGGGTDFKPGFEYLNEQDELPKAVVYFTDMECYSFPDEPEYPVLWAQLGSYRNEPPFGEVIKVRL